MRVDDIVIRPIALADIAVNREYVGEVMRERQWLAFVPRARIALSCSSLRLADVTHRKGKNACIIAASPPTAMITPNLNAKPRC